jgi:hypothetical protein
MHFVALVREASRQKGGHLFSAAAAKMRDEKKYPGRSIHGYVRALLRATRVYSSFPIDADRKFGSQVAFFDRGPQRRVFVAGVEVEAAILDDIEFKWIGKLL